MNKTENKVTNYWSKRADSYSNSVKESFFKKNEKEIWENLVYSQIGKDENLKILDVGTGPGMFSIVLGSNTNYEVTGTDSCAEMLHQARKNAKEANVKAIFEQSDAQAFSYNDEAFDVIVSRNVTWNLPHPKEAYKEWKRVLKKGGKILNFDANWYLRLHNEELQKKYEEIEKHEKVSIEMRREMEELAKNLPLSSKSRPLWDVNALNDLGFKEIFLNTDINDLIYDKAQIERYCHTPMFMISATK